MNMFNTKTIDRQAAQALGSPGERTEWQDALHPPRPPRRHRSIGLRYILLAAIASAFAGFGLALLAGTPHPYHPAPGETVCMTKGC